MVRQLLGVGLILFLIAGPLWAADPPEVKTGFDLIPINAAAGLAVHNLEEFKAEGAVFLKNAGLEKQLPMKPSQLFEMAFGFLGINRGRDDGLPVGIFAANLIEARVLDPSGINDLENLLVLGVGFSDRDQMASNFGLSKGELQPEQITKINREKNLFGKFLYVKGNHLYLGNNERAVLSVVQGKRLSEALTKPQLDRMRRSDILLHVGTTPWGAGWVQAVQRAKEHAKSLKDKETDPETGLSAEMLQLLADSLPAVQNVMFGVAIDDLGLEFNSLAVLRPGDHPAARKLLELLRSGEEPSSLAGLPKRNLIASQAVRSDGSQNRALVRAILDGVINIWISERKLLALTEQPQFVGLFDDVWQRLKGSQMAVYRNNDPASQGLFSMVAILDTAEPAEFLEEMRQLSRFAKPGELKLDGDDRQADDVATVEKLIKELGDSNFRIRQSASLKLSLIGPPALPYLEKALESPDREVVARARRLRKQIETTVEARRQDVLSQSLLSKLSARWGDFPNAETRQGLPIDIVKMDLQGESKNAQAKLREVFGPDWSKIRLAVQGKQIVVLMGSNVDLLEETLMNLKQQKPGLAESPLLKEFQTRAPASRRTEFHLILEQFVPLIQGEKPAPIPANDLTSLSLGIENDSIELHLWVPNSEFRAISRFR